MLHIFSIAGFIFLSTTSVKFGVIDMSSILSGSFVHLRARSVSITKLLFLISPMRNTSDFSKLILRPDTSENLLNVCKIAVIDSSLNSVNNWVSSAYCKIFYSLLPACMPFIFFYYDVSALQEFLHIKWKDMVTKGSLVEPRVPDWNIRNANHCLSMSF